MRKFIKNQKGFTLIELMMVIAVIGILAAVLIPKMSNSKDNAKLAGVDANVRQVQAAVTGMIQRYQDGNATVSGFAATLANACKGIQNPFNTAVDGVAATSINVTKAVTVDSDATDSHPTTADTNNNGHVYVVTTVASGKVTQVVIYPYDNLGALMPSVTVTP